MTIFDSLNKNIASLQSYQAGRNIANVAKEIGILEDDIIKLASNESALGVSPKALEKMQENLSNMHLYPDASGLALKEALKNHYSLQEENFILGAGSNEILVFLAFCFMHEGKNVVASEKVFIIYKILAKMFNCSFKEAKDNNLDHNLDAMLSLIDDNTSMIFVCNPNNPTGSLIEQESLINFIEQVPANVLIVLDEAYAEICLGQMPRSIEQIKNRENVIVLRTFSKAYGLAGLRIGYGISNAKLIQALEKVRQPFNTCFLSQIAAINALKDDKFIEDSKKVYREAKQYFEEEFTKLNISFKESFANFILFKVDDAARIYEQLMQQGFIVRPLKAYNLADYLRVTFSTPNNNTKFINALKELL